MTVTTVISKGLIGPMTNYWSYDHGHTVPRNYEALSYELHSTIRFRCFFAIVRMTVSMINVKVFLNGKFGLSRALGPRPHFYDWDKLPRIFQV